MTLERARIIKAAFEHPSQEATRVAPEQTATQSYGRRIARPIVDARAEAEVILARARAQAEAVLAAARTEAARVGEDAARVAREAEIARMSATFLALRRAEAERAEGDLDRAVELATLLAERLVGEALRVEPGRIAALAAAALAEARGARRVRIDAHPDDVDALREALASAARVADVNADAELPRGSLVVHTDLGIVDARLRPQLARLAVALREALR